MHAYPSCSIIIMHIYMHACSSYIASYSYCFAFTDAICNSRLASYIVTVSDLMKFDEPLHNNAATLCLFCMVLPRVLYHS